MITDVGLLYDHKKSVINDYADTGVDSNVGENKKNLISYMGSSWN